MKRIALTDGTGRWFDAEKAQCYDERTWWNGSEDVSRATGSSRAHEELYRTAGGRWVLCCWSDYDRVPTTYEEFSAAEAARWLAANEYEPHESCKQEYAELEIA